MWPRGVWFDDKLATVSRKGTQQIYHGTDRLSHMYHMVFHLYHLALLIFYLLVSNLAHSASRRQRVDVECLPFDAFLGVFLAFV